ncbi:MAG: hypothetical protein IIZ78_06720, partial [Clostridiales bacterium]|nr:hypothetical protein [Clostridiales bacterium]
MASKKVTMEQLPGAIKEILDQYEGEINRFLPEITEEVGKTGVKALRTSAKQKFNGKKYAGGWRSVSERNRYGATVTIYNGRLPGLPHLLEHGHAKRGGGRVDGRAHIAPVEEKLITDFEKKVEHD